MSYKIEFDRKNCRGCGACTICDNWKIDTDGKSSPIKTELEEKGCNQDAENSCPMGIIKVREV